jgi:hypothetical protein
VRHAVTLPELVLTCYSERINYINPFLPTQHNFFWQKDEKILRALPLSHSKIADIGQTGLFGASCAQAHLLWSISFRIESRFDVGAAGF